MAKLKAIFSNFLPIVGFVFLAAVVVVQLWYENSGRELFFSREVVKLHSEAKRGDIIDETMWYYDKVDKDAVINGVITDPSEILGMAVKQFIPENAQLNGAYFDVPELITDKEHLTMKIPAEWLYSIPNTLRGRDSILLKEVTSEVLNADDKDKAEGPSADPSADPNAVSDAADPNVETNDTASNAEIKVYDETDANKLADQAGKIVLETTVAFVKDSSNREVVTLSQKDRYDGSSVIRDVEIVVTLEEEKRLEEIRKKGSKFIIMYTEG